MADPSPKNCVIIGPSGSGKTCLLGVLQLATGQLADQSDKALRILPVSADMGELIALSNAAVKDGGLSIAPTPGVKHYVFDYEVTHNTPGNIFRQVSQTRFSLIDTPGGALLGERTSWAEKGFVVERMEEARAEAIRQLKTADQIMLCADSTDELAAADFVRYLPTALMETGTGRLACEKLVICLTKADKYVIETDGIATRDEFLYEDPVSRAVRVISRAGLNTLRMYLRDDVEIRAGWASVYGFEPKGGLPNYDPERDGLLIDPTTEATPAEILERWQPYQVINPFVFLTTGEPMGLKKIPPLGSAVQGLPQPEFLSRLQTPLGRFQIWLKRLWDWFRALVNYLK
jgi:GTPase SAR1 family protein